MQKSEALQRIDLELSRATSESAEKLISKPEWGSVNFEAARKNLELIFSLCTTLAGLPLEILPDPVAENFKNNLIGVNASLDQLKQFALEGSANPTQTRDAIVAQIRDHANALLTATQSWIPFLAYQKGDVQKNIEALTVATGQATKIVNDAVVLAESKKTEIDRIVIAAREASASAGVGVFTHDFELQAKTTEVEANVWLKVTGTLAVATLAIAIASFFIPIGKDATNAQVFQFMTSKIVSLAVLLAATIWCGKIFRALKHQAATSRHRGNALKTFQAFVNATGDESTRNAVLMETTRSIFAISPSGYLEGAEPVSEPSAKIFEVFKGSHAA